MRLGSILLLCATSSPGWAITVRVENPHGRVEVEGRMGTETVRFMGSSPKRQIRPGDVQYRSSPSEVYIVARSTEADPVDLKLTVPHSVALDITTATGSVSIRGIAPQSIIQTESGDISITAPLRLMRLHFRSDEPPHHIEAPQSGAIRFAGGKAFNGWIYTDYETNPKPLHKDLPFLWRLSRDAFSEVRVIAKTPGALTISNLELPDDAILRHPSDAPDLLRAAANRMRAPQPAPDSTGTGRTAQREPDTLVFETSVHLVPLTVSVHDSGGRPVTGLSPGEFEVVEDGSAQPVSFAKSEDAPFNLVLLLDLSGSTLNTRAMMIDAAQKFIGIARPGDRVAVYALANSLFHVVVPLSTDHRKAAEILNALPPVAGGTPLYDTLALSLLQGKLYESPDRSAVVVLTDGMDNQLELSGKGSRLSFKELTETVQRWNVLFYPILIPYQQAERQGAGRKRMAQLAAASGGEMFEANSLERLDPVYDEVARELRSVYALGYSPRNQNFDGAWRRVSVRLPSRPELKITTREGYYAR